MCMGHRNSEVTMDSVDGYERRRLEYIYKERVAYNGSSTSQGGIGDVVASSDLNMRGKERIRRMEHLDDYSSYVNRQEYVKFRGEDIRNPVESIRSRPPTDRWGVSRQWRSNYFLYHEEGPPQYDMYSYYEQGERTRYTNHDLYGPPVVENLENDRAELLRKIDELKNQLSASCDLTETNDRHTPSLRDVYPQRGHSYECADTYQQEMYRSSTHYLQSQYRHLSHHEHNHGYGNRYLPPKVESLSLYNQRSHNELSSDNYHPQLYPMQHSPQGYNSGSFSLHTTHSQQSLPLDSTEADSEGDGVNHGCRRKMVEAGKVWRPIVGGAPIVACSNCFELLKLPRRRMLSAQNQQKLKCGACSSIISFELGNRSSAVPVSGHVNHISTDIDERDDSKSTDMNVFSNYYDDCKPLDHLSSALSLHEDEQIPEAVASGKEGFQSADEYVKEAESFPHPLTSSEGFTDQCSANNMVSGYEKGNMNRRSDFDHNTPHKDYVEDSAVATETDMSLNELSNSGVSEDSTDKSEEHHPVVNKKTKSLFGGLIRKSLGNFRKKTQIVEVGKSQVFVNGHLIPDHLVEKAEELAGPIEPGEYWYDVHAGFWGVMGYPCLGIVMPNIEEFNYPMPEKCAAGNTGIFINGRELHQSDLGLLTRRGLPKTSQGSYAVEISGKAVDDHTGEVYNIGRLAPTVERAKHGFGMKVPTFIARLRS